MFAQSLKCLLCFGLAVASCGAAPAKSPASAITAADLARANALYAELHANPELSGQEALTAARLAQAVRALGFEVREHVGGHGVVALMRNGPGKTFMLRTELDALPVSEQTGIGEASRVAGVMHACGHDLHMAAWVATAAQLVRRRSEWQGTLLLVAQPAEETLTGARALLADGLLAKVPKPDVAFAIHVHDQLPLGTVGYTAGPFAASADSIDIQVNGRGGHGAYPQHAIDPIVIAARLVTALQTIASRESDPADPVVVSVGSIHGGSKHNVIPDSVKLQLTVRSYGVETRKRVLAAVQRIANAESAAAGAPPPTIVVTEGTAAAVSDPEWTRRVLTALQRSLPKAKLEELPREMGSEDFSEYARAGVPSVMLQLGVVEPAKYAAAKAKGESLPSAHSSTFLPARPGSLELAVQVEVSAALGVLGVLAK